MAPLAEELHDLVRVDAVRGPAPDAVVSGGDFVGVFVCGQEVGPGWRVRLDLVELAPAAGPRDLEERVEEAPEQDGAEGEADDREVAGDEGVDGHEDEEGRGGRQHEREAPGGERDPEGPLEVRVLLPEAHERCKLKELGEAVDDVEHLHDLHELERDHDEDPEAGEEEGQRRRPVPRPVRECLWQDTALRHPLRTIRGGEGRGGRGGFNEYG